MKTLLLKLIIVSYHWQQLPRKDNEFLEDLVYLGLQFLHPHPPSFALEENVQGRILVS